MKQIIVIAFLLLASLSFAQSSLKLTGGGVFATLPLPGANGVPIQFNQSYVYGALIPGSGSVSILPQGYGLVTGPVIGQPNFKVGAKFGPGGSFKSNDNNPFKTSPLCPCNFSGTFVSAQLTPVHLSDGTWVYTLTGELAGTFSTKSGTSNVRAFYTGTVDDQAGQFEVNAMGASGLDIIYQPN
jgi:hypothetical protein